MYELIGKIGHTLFSSNSIAAWLIRASILILLLLMLYVISPAMFNLRHKIRAYPRLEERENEVFLELRRIMKEEEELAKQKKLVKKKIEQLIKQAMELKKIEARIDALSSKENPTPLEDENLKNMMRLMDSLLGNLPDDVLDKFTSSKDFKIYKKTMEKYGIKS